MGLNLVCPVEGCGALLKAEAVGERDYLVCSSDPVHFGDSRRSALLGIIKSGNSQQCDNQVCKQIRRRIVAEANRICMATAQNAGDTELADRLGADLAKLKIEIGLALNAGFFCLYHQMRLKDCQVKE